MTRSALGERNAGRTEILAAACAVALTMWRVPLVQTSPFDLLVRPLQVDTSLSSDLVVRAAQGSFFTLALNALAHLFVWLHAVSGVTPESCAGALQIFLWMIQAVLMFRLARDVTQSPEAAFLATVFFGAKMPLAMLDGPYNMAFLRYSIAMPPFLWGMRGLVRDKPWQALLGIAASTYLHATPAEYAWPLLAWEEALRAWRRPRERRGVLARAGAAAVLACPLLWAAAGGGRFEKPPHFDEMGMSFAAGHTIALWTAGWADRVSMLEGIILVILALWRGRRLTAAPLLGRAMGVWLVFTAFGVAAYAAFEMGLPPSRLWLLSLPLQPADSRYLVDLVGQLTLAAWLGAELRRGESTALAALLLLSFSAYHDFVSRLFLIGILACLLWDRRKLALALAAGAALLPFLHWLAPGLLHGAVSAAGLRGGLFGLPAFHPASGAALAAALAWGRWGPRRLAAAAAAILAVGFMQGRPEAEVTTDRERMFDWIRRNTPPQAVIMISPLDLLDQYHSGARIGNGPYACWNYPPAMERELFACSFYAAAAPQFGAAAAPMLERLGAMGVDFGSISDMQSLTAELGRVDAGLAPEKVRRIASRWPVTDILLRSERPWPGRPLHREGGLALYSLGPGS